MVNVGTLIHEYQKGLGEILGAKLLHVVLYGSHARGEADEGSDVDVLCVLASPFDYGDMIRDTSELTSQISLKYDVTVSRVFIPQTEYDLPATTFVKHVREEGLQYE